MGDCADVLVLWPGASSTLKIPQFGFLGGQASKALAREFAALETRPKIYGQRCVAFVLGFGKINILAFDLAH